MGTPLPVLVMDAHVFPLPFTVNAIISLMLWLWKWSSELLCKLGGQMPAYPMMVDAEPGSKAAELARLQLLFWVWLPPYWCPISCAT